MSKYIVGKFYMTFMNGKPVAGYLTRVTEYDNDYVGIELRAQDGTRYCKTLKEEE